MTTAHRRTPRRTLLRPDRWSAPVLVAALVIGVLAVLLTAAARSSHPFPQPPVKTHTVAPSSAPPHPRVASRTPRKSSGDNGTSVVVLLVIVALVLVGLALVARHLRRPRGVRLPGWGRRARAPDLPPAAPAVAHLDAVAAAIDDALERDPDARSIIECWTALESALAALGHPRHPAETSTDYVERVLAVYGITAEPARRLGALYREARFSRHALPAAARESAHHALRALREELGAVPRAT